MQMTEEQKQILELEKKVAVLEHAQKEQLKEIKDLKAKADKMFNEMLIFMNDPFNYSNSKI